MPIVGIFNSLGDSRGYSRGSDSMTTEKAPADCHRACVAQNLFRGLRRCGLAL